MSVQELPDSKIVALSIEILSRGPVDGSSLSRLQLDLQLVDDCMGDFVLNGEDVSKITVIAVRPKVAP